MSRSCLSSARISQSMRISLVFIGHIQIMCACMEEYTKGVTCLMLVLPTDLTKSHLHCRAQKLSASRVPAIWQAVRQTAAKTSVLKSSFEIISSQREILFQHRISVSHHRQLQAKIQGMQSATCAHARSARFRAIRTTAKERSLYIAACSFSWRKV